MKKNPNNITLAICLIFIFSISIYFIVQKIKSENINHYLDFLGSKLMAMIPEDKKKEEAAQLYDKFKQQVEEKKVAPGRVEKLAAEILNLENISDSLRWRQAEKAMELALSIPKLEQPKISVNIEEKGMKYYTPHPEDEKKWQELGEHLKNIYIFEENIKQKEKQKEAINRRLFQYDSNLQVIIDSQLRTDLLRDADRNMVEAIKELEKQKWLVWEDKYERELREKMKEFQDSTLEFKIPYNTIDTRSGGEVIVPRMDTIRIRITLPPDSLKIPPVLAP